MAEEEEDEEGEDGRERGKLKRRRKMAEVEKDGSKVAEEEKDGR